jgi:hypothetical protein
MGTSCVGIFRVLLLYEMRENGLKLCVDPITLLRGANFDNVETKITPRLVFVLFNVTVIQFNEILMNVNN